MTRFIHVAACLIAAAGLAGCDRISGKLSGQADGAATSAEASFSRFIPKRIEDARHPDSLKVEAEQIAAHPGRAKRDNFVLTLLRDGEPIASFEDRFDADCPEACGAYSYDGVYQLIDPATGRLTGYDHVSISYSEDIFEYLVDRDGRVYVVGYSEALVSPGKTFLATADHNINGNGEITILDWKSKVSVQFGEGKGAKQPAGCWVESWSGAERLLALCQITSGLTYSEVEIVRQPDGGWRMRELRRYDPSAISDDENGIRLKQGASGVAPKTPFVTMGVPLAFDGTALTGYRRPVSGGPDASTGVSNGP